MIIIIVDTYILHDFEGALRTCAQCASTEPDLHSHLLFISA